MGLFDKLTDGLKDELKEKITEGIQEEIKERLTDVDYTELISKVAGMVKDGQSAEKIAEGLVQNLDVIRPIYDLVKKNPDFDVSRILEQLGK